LILIPIYGLVGAAISTLGGYSLMSILSFGALSNKFNDFKLDFKGIMMPSIAGLIFLISLSFMKSNISFQNIWIETIAVVGVSGVIYIVSLFALKVVSIKQITELINLYKLRN